MRGLKQTIFKNTEIRIFAPKSEEIKEGRRKMDVMICTVHQTLWSKSQAKLPGHFSPVIPSFADRGLSCRLHVEAPRGESGNVLKAGESNGNLPLRNCLECSVPEPYRSPDWALVPAKTGFRAEY